jgi:glycosidase
MKPFRTLFSALCLTVLVSIAGCADDEIAGKGRDPLGGESPFDNGNTGDGGYAKPNGCLGGSGGSSGAGTTGATGCVSGATNGNGNGAGTTNGGNGEVSGGTTAEVDAGPPPPPCNLVTFKYDGVATSVLVTGSFTSWAATEAAGALAMAEVTPGHWEVTHLVEPEGTHSYKLVVDGTWKADPSNPVTEDDTFGGRNSVLSVCRPTVGADECDLTKFSWRDPVMYFAMTDRFYDSDSMAQPVTGATDRDATTGPSGQYEGGDLAGVTAKMAYLADMGVTTLWLSAPYDNRDIAGEAIDPSKDKNLYSGYHGYWPSPADIDYSDPTAPAPVPAVESRIGTATDLKDLIAAAHAAKGANGQGLKVLFDYVMRHADLESGLYDAHPEWFYQENGAFPLCGASYWDETKKANVIGWDHPFYTTHCAFTPYLAPFDFDDEEARAWSVADAMWWAREYGIDGYRLDAIKHVPLAWLNELRAQLNAEFTMPAGNRFYLVGETFDYGNRQLLKSFVDPKTMLDGQFDFPLKLKMCQALFRPEGDLAALETFMKDNDTFYGPGAIMSTWIGNHDIPRAIHFASGEITDCARGSESDPSNPNFNAWTDKYKQPTDAPAYERLGLAFALLLTNRGVPLIYYGDEVGLAGGGDPDDRRMMPWNDAGLNQHQLALRANVRALSRIRAENPVLGRGVRTTLAVTKDTWVYKMEGCDADPVTVAINRSDAAASVAVPAGSYTNLVDGTTLSGGAQMLAPRGFLVLR